GRDNGNPVHCRSTAKVYRAREVAAAVDRNIDRARSRARSPSPLANTGAGRYETLARARRTGDAAASTAATLLGERGRDRERDRAQYQGEDRDCQFVELHVRASRYVNRKRNKGPQRYPAHTIPRGR